MDFQELTDIWNDSVKEREIRINESLFREAAASRIRSGLRSIRWTAWFEVIIGLLWMSFLAGFISDHLNEVQFLLPALVLLLIDLYSILINMWQLVLNYRISAHDEVFKTQKRLEKIRFLEKFDTLSLLFIIPLFSVPFFIVIAEGLFNFDLYIVLGLLDEFVFYYCAGSVVIAAVLVFILLRFPSKSLKDSIDFLRSLNTP